MLTKKKETLVLSKSEQKLVQEKFLLIKELADDFDIERLKRYYMLASRGISNNEPLPLLDGSDVTNFVYRSNRSKNLQYAYLKGKMVSHIQNKFSHSLKLLFPNLVFENSINKYCLPIFTYGQGSEIKAHRGVEKTEDLKRYQEYVCVILLHQPNVDFTGGRFYINPKAEASSDGKTVWNDYPEDRTYPKINKGDAVIFHNPSLVHRVEKVHDGFRATVSVRSNNKLV